MRFTAAHKSRTCEDAPNLRQAEREFERKSSLGVFIKTKAAEGAIYGTNKSEETVT